MFNYFVVFAWFYHSFRFLPLKVNFWGNIFSSYISISLSTSCAQDALHSLIGLMLFDLGRQIWTTTSFVKVSLALIPRNAKELHKRLELCKKRRIKQYRIVIYLPPPSSDIKRLQSMISFFIKHDKLSFE